LEERVQADSIEIHPSLLVRKIIHVDMDAFYASVEMRDNPTLKGKPVVIGGSPQSRGVVCTASYEARKYGIRSAMPCSRALRLCPEAVFVPPNFEKYKLVSNEIRKIFQRYTALIEPLSLDEAFLDVTHNTDLYAVQIGKAIRSAIEHELNLTCSVGVAPNKLVAKIASDYRKPGGLTVVPPDKVFPFMNTLPVRRLFGVGPATEARLSKRGIHKCADLIAMSSSEAMALLGQQGLWLHQAAQGIDLRPVQSDRIRKSFGREETFSIDISDLRELETELRHLCVQVQKDLLRSGKQCRTVTLKVKYSDFSVVTRSWTQTPHYESVESIFEAAKQLLVSKTDAGQRPVRLIGVSGTNLVATQEAVDTNRSATRLNGDTELVEGQTVNGWKSLF
jgi:DNA polymerase IV